MTIGTKLIQRLRQTHYLPDGIASEIQNFQMNSFSSPIFVKFNLPCRAIQIYLWREVVYFRVKGT